MDDEQTERHKPRLRRIFTRKHLLITGGLIAAFLVITPIATYVHFARDISDPERLMNRNNRGVMLKDRNGETIYEYGRVSDGDNLRLDQVSDDLERALLASEDQGFYKHQGYSLRGIVGAMRANASAKDPTKYGGSTITQQLVKNKLFTADKNFFRKYQEVSMAVAVERKYSKQEILEMYLNSVYFGEGAFGIGDAAQTYFKKHASDLNLAESAMLVGLLPAPSVYSPISGNQALAKQQQAAVLRKMVDAGYIDSQARVAAESTQLQFAPPREGNFASAQHYILMVLEELKAKYGEERMMRSGFVVTTTLDKQWQSYAEAAVQKHIQQFQAAGGRNAGLVAIDPKTGEVRALVGSVDWDNAEFGKVNMALAPRQPGSSFKPIFYSQALDQRLITPATILHDKPTDFGGWQPENHDLRYRGNITVRHALAQSLNIPAAEVMQKLGTHNASLAAQRIGVSTVNQPDIYGLSLALGTAEARLLDMTSAYAAFANRGLQYKPRLITHISDKFNESVFSVQKREVVQARSPEAAFLTSSILSDPAARAPTFGSSLDIPGRDVAVKTGTTNDNKDAWTIGYTPGVSIGVWVGNNENQPMDRLAGGSSAGKIWKDVMSQYLKGLPDEPFVKPAGVVQVQLCKGSGLRAVKGGTNTFKEYFIRGTEPAGTCNTERPKPQRKATPPPQIDVQQAQAPVVPEPDENRGRDVGGRGAGDDDGQDELPDDGNSGSGGGGSNPNPPQPPGGPGDNPGQGPGRGRNSPP